MSSILGPSLPGDPSLTPRVIGAGYSRTGTVSFTIALQKLLNGPVCHTGSVCFNREEAIIKQFCAIGKADPVKDHALINNTLRGIFAGYVGLTDSPGSMYVGELAEVYPDAVVICTTRDAERWWESVQELEKTVVAFWMQDILFAPMPSLRYFKTFVMSMAPSEVLVTFPSFTPNTHTLSTVYPPLNTLPDHLQIHAEYLKRVVPSSRLFFFDVKDGWAPLCKILECPIPDEPFPHANENEAMQEFFAGMFRAAVVRWMQIIAGGGLLAVFGVWIYGRYGAGY
ncbi:hypothetical protein LHYA1_G005085 [Lachnellula hyalina]|uniref:NAD dependent epimerase/dehydratase n=1 Tax=Lachnellula hyalina TaxID=1316788 RepID=A0A8H8R3G2_9HELO|nr:uncharacterized protein LHYA1_G005085 [Lachnellula hyalina]TVY26961.1 hypothetical protein LHYA1_G005085 [Lachnellula hyalina]